MIFCLLFFAYVAIAPALNSVTKEIAEKCRVDEFQCGDGSCVRAGQLCDGTASCPDGSDENNCHLITIRSAENHNNSTELNPPTSSIQHPYIAPFRSTLQRTKRGRNPHNSTQIFLRSRTSRETAKEDDFWRKGFTSRVPKGLREGYVREKRQNRCSAAHWQCRNGQCIDSDGKCDGVKNCADGSDETHALCRNLACPEHLFRCTYGACVDGYSKCNNVTDCVDNSDELHPDCSPGSPVSTPGRFRCDSGATISTTARCDGRADCADRSDETVRACGATRCHSAHLFQCAYGACVDAGSDCDNKRDCADGSDEADDLCNRMSPGTSGSTPPSSAPPAQTPVPIPTGGACVLPPYPSHGRYTVESSDPAAGPGSSVPAAQLKVRCDPGYMPEDNYTVVCFGSSGWNAPLPRCVEYCTLTPHRSVTYNCVVPETQGGTKICPRKVPRGTVVKPTCNAPNYYSRSPVPYMKCLDGQFDYIAFCEPGLYQGTLISVVVKDKTTIYIDKFNYTNNDTDENSLGSAENVVTVVVSDANDKSNVNLTDEVSVETNDSAGSKINVFINSTYINIGIDKINSNKTNYNNSEEVNVSSSKRDKVVCDEDGKCSELINFEIDESDWRIGRVNNGSKRKIDDYKINEIFRKRKRDSN